MAVEANGDLKRVASYIRELVKELTVTYRYYVIYDKEHNYLVAAFKSRKDAFSYARKSRRYEVINPSGQFETILQKSKNQKQVGGKTINLVNHL